ncbi:MAG: hypothetical protein J7M19_05595, partial [Planctomycetes bacterium]|nr:hypothetical protein [Planctomycetota bacterium]
MSRKIGQLLLSKGLISSGDLAEAQRIQREGNPELDLAPGEKLGRIITRGGFAPPMDVVRALCEQRSIDDYMLVGRYIISPSLVARVPLEVAKRYNVLPVVSLDGSGEALFATVKMPSADETAEMESLLGLAVEWLEVKDRHFSRIVDRVYALMVERGVSSVRIGEVLVREGLVTLQEVEWALRIAQRSNRRIGRVLMDEGLIGEQEFFRVLAHHEG